MCAHEFMSGYNIMTKTVRVNIGNAEQYYHKQDAPDQPYYRANDPVLPELVMDQAEQHAVSHIVPLTNRFLL